MVQDMKMPVERQRWSIHNTQQLVLTCADKECLSMFLFLCTQECFWLRHDHVGAPD